MQCCTSATLGSEDQNAEVADFASRLCNSSFAEKDVVRAIRENPKRDSMNIKQRSFSDYSDLAKAISNESESDIKDALKALKQYQDGVDLKSIVYDMVINDQNYWNVRSLLQKKTQTVYSMAKTLECSTTELEHFVTVAAYSYKNDTMLLDAKYHMFVKACDSAFITLGKSKKLMLTRKKQIFDQGKEYAVFEIGVCTFCHSIYLLGKLTATGYFMQRSVEDGENTQEILYLGNSISDEDDEHTLKNGNIDVEEMLLCSRCGKLMSKNAAANECCEHTPDDYVSVFHVQTKKKVLTKCVACENVSYTLGVLRQFYAGQEAVTSVLGTALFEALPSYKLKQEKIVYGAFVMEIKY